VSEPTPPPRPEVPTREEIAKLIDGAMNAAARRRAVNGEWGELHAIAAEDAAKFRSALLASVDRLCAALAEARRENDVNHGWVYCPMCGSCGIGGCCGYFCDFCKSRHDGETQDDSPPRDLGNLGLMQGGWQEKVTAAERERDEARAERDRAVAALGRLARDVGLVLDAVRWDDGRYEGDACVRDWVAFASAAWLAHDGLDLARRALSPAAAPPPLCVCGHDRDTHTAQPAPFTDCGACPCKKFRAAAQTKEDDRG